MIRYSKNFNPPTLGGVGPVSGSITWIVKDFNPPTLGGVGQAGQKAVKELENFNPPTLGGVGPVLQYFGAKKQIISILPPWVGWDG